MKPHNHWSQWQVLRGMILVLVGFGIWLVNPQSVVDSKPPDQAVPGFEETKCSDMFPGFSWQNTDARRFRCGYFLIWENDKAASAGNIRLPVMVTLRKNAAPDPKHDPVIYLDGGPGGTGFGYAPSDALKLADNFGRDFIQFGQRGSVAAKPGLICSEYRDAVINNWEKPLGWMDLNRARTKALSDCLVRLKGSKNFSDISNFNGDLSALDVVNLVKRLGYERANLYGVSYGTLLAQHILYINPAFVRSVVLDGVLPLGVDFDARLPLSMQRSLNEIFTACSSDPACQNAYPDLEPFFYRVVDQLNQQPARISVQDNNKTYSNVYLDGYGFLESFRYLLYSSNIQEIPRIIYAAGNGNFTEIGNNLYSFQRLDRYAWGMYYSVYCTEFARFNPDGADLTKVNSRLRILTAVYEQRTNAVCPLYDPQNKSYGDLRISGINAPVLIFNGKFDPVTPPEYGSQVAAAFTKHNDFTSPVNAHGSSGSECAQKMIKEFLSSPEIPVNGACWNDLPQKITFNTLNPEITNHRLRIWWDETRTKIEQSVNQGIEKFRQQAENFVREKLLELENSVKNWFLVELPKWLQKQLPMVCSSMGVPVGLVSGFLIRQYRRNRRQPRQQLTKKLTLHDRQSEGR